VNVQCVLCKEIVDIGDFRSSERGIEITCAACGGSYGVDAPQRTEPEPERVAAEGERECPKCGAPAAQEGVACIRCGLAADRFESFARDEAEQVPEALAELWDACEGDWRDAEAHDRFVRAAVAAEAFRYAASKYRGALRSRPGDTEAKRRLADIRRRAEAAILQTAAAGRYAPEGKEPYRGAALLLVILIALAIVGMVYAVFLRDNGAPR
jgi:hypothetical protein